MAKRTWFRRLAVASALLGISAAQDTALAWELTCYTDGFTCPIATGDGWHPTPPPPPPSEEG